MKYTVLALVGEPPAGIFSDADRTSPPKMMMFPGQIVEIEKQEENDDWVRDAFPESAPGLKGWIEKKYIDFDAAEKLEPEEFTDSKKATFVLECARHEYIAREAAGIDAHSNADAPLGRYIIADYLIALALLETDLKKVDIQLPRTDAIGPFQVTSDEWTAYRFTPAGIGVTDSERASILFQIPAGSFLTLKDWKDFDAEVGGDENEFVPSFLDLFLARLMGAAAAYHVSTVNGDEDKKSQDLLDTIKQKVTGDAYDALVERRAKWLKPSPGNAPYSVSGFIDMVSNKMTKALISAFELLRKYAPDFVIPPAGSETPWLGKAESELPFWNGRKESDPEGTKRIAEVYFPATDHPPVTTAVAWCGAFAAWSMKDSGNDVAAASVPKGAAKAANWRNWGTQEIRPGAIRKLNDDALQGSVVVFRSDENTDEIGHVGFAVKRAPTSEKIDCISGNDSNTARQRPYDISRIVAIRQLDIPAPGAGDGSFPITAIIADFVKDWEGFSEDAYWDKTGKVWTIGYGTTSRAGIGVEVKKGMKITEAEAVDYLTRTLKLFSHQIVKGFNDRKPKSDQFGSMLSMAYNIGAGGFLGSTVLRMFNAKDDAAAAEAFKLWNKSGGKVLPGLVKRRAAESQWYLGNYTRRND